MVLPLLGLGLLIWGNEALDRLLIAKIRSDLAVANGYFERVLSEVHGQTALLAESSALLGALNSDERDHAVPKLLTKAQERDALDFVNLRGPDGRLWYSSTSKVQATLESAWEAPPA